MKLEEADWLQESGSVEFEINQRHSSKMEVAQT